MKSRVWLSVIPVMSVVTSRLRIARLLCPLMRLVSMVVRWMTVVVFLTSISTLVTWRPRVRNELTGWLNRL